MSLDKSKPHGTVHGHPWAHYEQGGTLYDANGDSYDEMMVKRDEGDSETESSNFRPDPTKITQNAKEFLLEFLKEGQIPRDEVYKESENKGYQWEWVKKAAEELDVKQFRRANITYWKLNLEV